MSRVLFVLAMVGVLAGSVFAVESSSASGASEKPRIVNIVNFIRAVEPREKMDLIEPVVNQIRLVKEHDLPATFLVQYDALLDPRFTDLLKELPKERYEVGGWFEVVQPQCEKAGIPWRGRYPWDWHTDVGFSIGYTPQEREKLVDVFIDEFKRVFGYTPQTIGSWFIDAHTLTYMADKYGVIASCNCKEQSGTDGYTLWGGYWNQAYYPSRLNALMPAQTATQQIPIPVFRMLGSDPIYQYDSGLGENGQGVITLEPVYCEGGGGGWPKWVRWFLDTLTQEPCLTFAYTQAGQENSFGWPKMSKGLTDQIEVLAELSKQGKVRVETMADSARWFRAKFPLTPPSAVVATKDWKDEGHRSVWYDSRFYRCNLFWDGGQMRVRDIHLFDEKYAERYLATVVKTPNCSYDTLPVLDGFHWSSKDALAGIRPVTRQQDGTWKPMTGKEPCVQEMDDKVLRVQWPTDSGQAIEVLMSEDTLQFSFPGVEWALEMRWSPEKKVPIANVEGHCLSYVHNDFPYVVRTEKGVFEKAGEDPAVLIKPENGEIALQMNIRTETRK